VTTSQPIDVVINAKKYAVYKDAVEAGADLAFKRVADIPLSRTASGAIPLLWNDGFSAGMGYGRAVEGGPGDAYAYSAGFDAHLPGLVRLHGRRVSVTPDTPPSNTKTDFFEASAAGSAEYSVSSFVKSTTVGNHTQSGVTHGLTSAPKAIIFWTSAGTADGTVAAGTVGMLGMTDGTNERVISWASDDNVGTSNSSRRALDTYAIDIGAGSAQANITNIGATTFDVEWDGSLATAEIIHFLAIGGSEVEASVDEWTLPATFDSTSVTSVGFTPELCIHISGGTTTFASGSVDDADFRWGMMDENGNQWANAIYSQDAQGTSNTKRDGSSGNALIGSTGNASVAQMQSMDSDGFTMLHLNTGGDGAMAVATLSLKGILARVGNFTKKTATGDEVAVSLPFTSTAFMLSSVMSTTDDSVGTAAQDHAAISIGGGSGVGAGVGNWDFNISRSPGASNPAKG